MTLYGKYVVKLVGTLPNMVSIKDEFFVDLLSNNNGPPYLTTSLKDITMYVN